MNAPWLAATRVGLAIAAAALVGCRGRPDPPPTTRSPYPELGITAGNFPRVDGSTSAQPLLAMVACKVLGAGYQWVHAEEDDSRTLWASDIDEMFRDPSYRGEKARLCQYINEIVHYRGTHDAYVNLIGGRADLILVARPPSDEEVRLAGRRGVPLDRRPVASDAFVFLLNAANPVRGLTIEQIRDIYSGRVVNWRQVGGPDAPIRPYQRIRNSGSQELMRTLVMKGRPMIEAPDLLTGAIMSSPYLAIDDDVHGIGYSVYYYHEFMAPRASVKACEVEGVLPSAESLRARRYPFVTEVFAVARRDLPAEHAARRLRDWLLGPTGQKIVEESGYVPVLEAARDPPHEPRAAPEGLEPAP